MSRLLIATTNRGKQEEFRRLLAPLDAELVVPQDLGLDLDVPEPHDTYAENAAEKAAAFARASGLVSLADDSGIEIAALDWGPGVRSARWGGGRNADRVLETLRPGDDRRARMVCAVAVAVPADASAPQVEIYTGVVEGRIADTKRGDGGFGYDPIFELPGGLTTAELPPAEKDGLSHRGRAVAAAVPRLQELLAGH
ncbi:MAG: non-canonical purine NTP pyrophosphatase [Chloroflexota bacterium]|nr:non-canonical purine NTP pyrophosphatase [Chloroflexota bacterium]